MGGIVGAGVACGGECWDDVCVPVERTLGK